MERIVLKLYVAGFSPRSQKAITSIQQLCDEVLKNAYELVVIDVLEQPHLAGEDEIIATPTLVKVSPLPSERIFGNVSDREKVLTGLGLKPEGS